MKNLFRLALNRSGRTPAPSIDNPYLNARRTWNDNAKKLALEKENLVIIALLALLIALSGVAGVIYVGSQSKFVPYIIKVDQLGQALAVGPAETLTEPNQQLVIRSKLAAFINEARLVTPDTKVQSNAIYSVYGSLTQNDPAMAKMNQWYNETEQSQPFIRAQKETVSVQIDSALPLSDLTWQVDWTETTRDRQGFEVKPPEKWRAIMTIYLVPPTNETSEAQLYKNPLGLYVKDFSWSKQLGE